MEKFLFFAQINSFVLPIIAAVPKGRVGTSNFVPDETSQQVVLRAKGWQLHNGKLVDFVHGSIAVANLDSGIPRPQSPADAPGR
jgi:hypothetical protein